MVKRSKTETYYAVRETCPQPYYDVQIDYNDDNTKDVIKYIKKHPEALSHTVVVIYSTAEPCTLKLYNTIEECQNVINNSRALNQMSSCGSYFNVYTSVERVVRIKKKVRITTEEETIIADNQFPK